MNIAEILKDVPRGTKLYSPIFGDVLLDKVNKLNIEVLDTANNVQRFIYTGLYNLNGECMLFPSRENRDWNTFSYCPFKNGDVIIRNDGVFIAIFSHLGIEGLPFTKTVNYHCWVKNDGTVKCLKDYGIGAYPEFRLATEEEKEFFFKALTEKGFKWNAKTLSLEKIEVRKFDTNTLKPFDKVLVRDHSIELWKIEFYSHFVKGIHYMYRCIGNQYHQCVPYNDETKHLVGTDKDCSEYYKTW